MLRFKTFFFLLTLMMACLSASVSLADDKIHIPILVYHNFNPTKPGSMNLTPKKFEAQIQWIKDNGFTIIPLKEAVAYLKGDRATLPEKSVVVTVDDGWQSAYIYLYPIIKKYNIPVTLFIYPETISTGKNAMTWEELKKMQQNSLVDIQGHTWSHPNFKQEKKHLSENAFQKSVHMELARSKQILEEKLGIKITLLAWPFGIYDPYLEEAAKKAGYDMAFSIDAKAADRDYRPMAQPRFMIVDGQSMKTFQAIVNTARKKS
ncbi:MAG TPA: polysaccharide deacetylase family protein [Gammaproteobacteria bacterium]|nr:polysaccharide deacetylase family protein [Gammaproteobacteria bacterium]